MPDVWKDPTPEQEAHAAIVAHDIVEIVNRLIREGIDPRVVIAGLGSATADTLTCVFGPTSVAPWFEGQGEMVRRLQRGN